MQIGASNVDLLSPIPVTATLSPPATPITPPERAPTDSITASSSLSPGASRAPREGESLSRLARAFMVACAALLALWSQGMVFAARGEALPAPPFAAWALLASAAVLVAAASWPAPKLTAFPAIRERTKRRVNFLVPFVVSLTLGIASAPLFWQLNANPEEAARSWVVNSGSWILYLASLFAWVFAFVVREGELSVSSAPIVGIADSLGAAPLGFLPRRVEWAVAGALGALALALRFVNLGRLPIGFWFDEAQNGVVARELLAPGAAHLTFVSGYTQMGALYFYLLGWVIEIFGSSVWTVRALPAASGALCVVLLYFLAARLYGWRAGVSAAFILAVSSWNLTFSRLGLVSMFTVALNVAVYTLFVKGLRSSKLIYFAFGGALLGLGAQTYFVARLVPAVIAALMLHLLLIERIGFGRVVRAGLGTFALGALLGVLPVGLFAAQRPEQFNERVKVASVFSPEGGGGDPAVIRENFVKHWLMFNYEGDWNGRHNLPHAPLLGWVTALLFFVGLGVCLCRAWRWHYFFPPVWFALNLTSGALSLSFEAPQAHRTLENSVVTALCAGIALGAVWQIIGVATAKTANASRRSSRLTQLATPAILAPIAVGIVLTAVGAQNIRRYFYEQSDDPTVWADMTGGAALAAETVARRAATHDVYTSSVNHKNNLSAFLSPGAKQIEWEGMHQLPFAASSAGDRGVVLLLDPSDAFDIALIERLYPHAEFEVLRAPHNAADGNAAAPLLYRISVPASDLSELHGVRVRSEGESKADSAQNQASASLAPTFEVDLSNRPRSNDELHLTTTLRAHVSGDYDFGWEAPRGFSATLVIDGQSVRPGQKLSLDKGLHSVAVAARSSQIARGGGGSESSPPAVARLLWRPPDSPQLNAIDPRRLFDPSRVAPHGLVGRYRAGTRFDAPPAIVRLDPIVSFNFHHTPLPRPYTVEWVGRLYAPQSGMYALGAQSKESIKLFVDGTELLGGESSADEAHVSLSTGFHEIKLLYADSENYSEARLYWTPPKKDRAVIPSAFLWRPANLAEDGRGGAAAPLPRVEEHDGSKLTSHRLQEIGADW